MKKFIIAIIVIAGVVYLFLVLAVNNKEKEFKKLKMLEPDSIKINDTVYYNKKAGK